MDETKCALFLISQEYSSILCLFPYRALASSFTGKGKGKVLPSTGHEGTEGEQMYSSTLPSTSALDGGA